MWYENYIISVWCVKCIGLFPLVNGNRNLAASTIMDKYKIGKVIGDGNFAVVKECVER